MADKRSDLAISIAAMIVLGVGALVGAYYLFKGSVMIEEDVARLSRRGRGNAVSVYLAFGGLLLAAGGLWLLWFSAKYLFNMLRRGHWEDED